MSRPRREPGGLRAAPARRDRIVGTFLTIGEPALAEMLAGAFDLLVIDALTYPPHGVRGFGPRRANGYGRQGDYHQTARERIACITQVETAAGLRAVADIAGTPGVDALLIGPSDLSFELGVPLQTFAPAMLDAIGATLAAADEAGISCAFAGNIAADKLPELLDHRCNVLLQATDLRIYVAAADATAATARVGLEALAEQAAPQ